MLTHKSSLIFLVFIFLACCSEAQTAKDLYWTSDRGIHHAKIGEDLVFDIARVQVGQLYNIALDVEGGKMYWTDIRTNELKRANLDGSGIETVISYNSLASFTLDHEENKIYWLDFVQKKVKRSNLNGNSVEEVCTISRPGLSVFEFNLNRMYSYKEGVIYSTDLETCRQDSFTLDKTFKTSSMAVSAQNGRFFWTTFGSSHNLLNYNGSYSVIWRSNLDGSGLQATNVRRFFEYHGIAIDDHMDKMYWTGERSSYPRKTGKIFRANFDGTDEEELITFAPREGAHPSKIALDLENEKMYWTDQGSGKITRANLDGSHAETLIEPELEDPYSIALDSIANKIYWVNASPTRADKVQRSNLDGTDVETLVTQDQVNPQGISLDLENQLMYWVNSTIIHRAKLDGSEVEDLVKYTSNDRPNGIALDLNNGKMYWTLNGKTQILRANLDGSDIEELVTLSYRRLRAIALDVDGNKMYWTTNNIIQRANLDGSEVEELITEGLSYPIGLALDLKAGKIYWADKKLNKIKRANLDGSNIEDVLDTYNPKWVIVK